jgi:DNA-binding Lrp family transcriptional regulator
MRPQHRGSIKIASRLIRRAGAVGREAGELLSAYVLIETEVGKVAHVAQAITELDGVQLAEDLAGPYDVIANVQAPSLDELGRLVVSHIQVQDGVTRTVTCLVLRR